ncbi:TPA: HypC/HybG/HupF family hydrogenase formation chaperone [bacterium]|nr:HypC/HybG/HupF family hydrogenase formation chaperone [bacterium]
MCLAVPARVVKIDGSIADLEIGGVIKRASLDLVEEVKVGDYVILHAGFAIQKLDEREAKETLRLLSQMELA